MTILFNLLYVVLYVDWFLITYILF